MIETDQIVSVQFSSIPATMPSVWYLGNFIPTGALASEHIQVRTRQVGQYWSPWGPVDAWNQTTKTATYFRAVVLNLIEFRRVTPKAMPFVDPITNQGRVSQRNLWVNANQGVFVAVEDAAALGIDARITRVTDPEDSPNQLKLVQRTQNHWGIGTDFSKVQWPFQFSGGYIDRSHVKAQVKTPSGWQQLTIDYSDPTLPSASPFKFTSDFQLHLNLASLGVVISGLIIYRFTPRNVEVFSPTDASAIVATGVEPSARQAFYIAIEIGEELAKRAAVCTCPGQYYTSGLYPVFTQEQFGVFIPSVPAGSLWDGTKEAMTVAIPSISGGSLTSVVVIYSNWRDVVPESMTCTVPAISSGSLAITVINYTNWRDITPESMTCTVPTISTGSLAVTVINYTNWRDVVPESMTCTVPTISSGSLT